MCAAVAWQELYLTFPVRVVHHHLCTLTARRYVIGKYSHINVAIILNSRVDEADFDVGFGSSGKLRAKGIELYWGYKDAIHPSTDVLIDLIRLGCDVAVSGIPQQINIPLIGVCLNSFTPLGGEVVLTVDGHADRDVVGRGIFALVILCCPCVPGIGATGS